MRFLLTFVLTLALAAGVAQANVVISQAYGGGGSTNPAASFNQDFLELFNAGTGPIDISGWWLEYGSATGTWGSSGPNRFEFPEGTVMPACSYLLIACGNVNTGGPPLPYWDFVSGINAAAANGKFALFTEENVNVPCGSEVGLVDMVGYGTSNCYEGTGAAPATAIDTSVSRLEDGYVDTDDNAADFFLNTSPNPRWSGSPLQSACEAVPVETIDWGTLKGQFR